MFNKIHNVQNKKGIKFTIIYLTVRQLTLTWHGGKIFFACSFIGAVFLLKLNE
jgi:hypothetical protein